LLRVNNIKHSFGTNDVLKGVSFHLKESALGALIGPSGDGKSTLLKILGSIIKGDCGDFQTGAAESISLMFQEGALFDSLSVFDNVAFPLVRGKVPITTLKKEKRDEVIEKVSSILARVGLSNAGAKLPAQISGGMRRRVSLARALVGKSKLILLDDPTAGLDPVASSVIMDLIVEICHEENTTALIAGHDLRRLLPVVDHIYALFDGEIQFSGNLEELRATDDARLRTFVSSRYNLSEAA